MAQVSTSSCLEDIMTLMWWVGGVNVTVSMVLIFINVILFCVLKYKREALSRIVKVVVRMKNAGQVVGFVRMPARGVMLVAERLQIDAEGVKAAYRRDAHEPQAVIYSLFGRDSFVKRFVGSRFAARFLKRGYAVESAILGRRP